MKLTLFQRALITVCRFGLFIYLGFGLYRLWSTIHRLLFDRRWKDTPLPTILTLREVVSRMRHFRWKRDGMSELFDAVCTPQKVQAVGFDGSSPHGNDCDEEAIWLTNVISKNWLALLNHDGVSQAHFLTVTWYEPGTRKFGGHNVCLLRRHEWGKSELGWSFMDYGEPSILCKTIDEVAQLVVDSYAGWDTTGHGTQRAIMLVWCVADKNLKPVVAKAG